MPPAFIDRQSLRLSFILCYFRDNRIYRLDSTFFLYILCYKETKGVTGAHIIFRVIGNMTCSLLLSWSRAQFFPLTTRLVQLPSMSHLQSFNLFAKVVFSELELGAKTCRPGNRVVARKERDVISRSCLRDLCGTRLPTRVCLTSFHPKSGRCDLQRHVLSTFPSSVREPILAQGTCESVFALWSLINLTVKEAARSLFGYNIVTS